MLVLKCVALLMALMSFYPATQSMPMPSEDWEYDPVTNPKPWFGNHMYNPIYPAVLEPTLPRTVAHRIPSTNGVEIGIWHTQPAKPQTGEPRVVLFLHGANCDRSQPLSVAKYKLFSETYNSHVIGMDYRGDADSSPANHTEKGYLDDVQAVWNWIGRQSGIKDVQAKNIFIYGHSLGTGVALGLGLRLSAFNVRPAGIMLEAPFTSVEEAFLDMWSLPSYVQKPIISPDRKNLSYDNLYAIDKIYCPILIMHGNLDQYIKVAHSHKLFAKSKVNNKKVRFFEIPGADHDIQADNDLYFLAIKGFIK